MVKTVSAGRNYRGNLGRDIIEGEDKAEQEGKTIGNGSGVSRGRRANDRRLGDRYG